MQKKRAYLVGCGVKHRRFGAPYRQLQHLRGSDGSRKHLTLTACRVLRNQKYCYKFDATCLLHRCEWPVHQDDNYHVRAYRALFVG